MIETITFEGSYVTVTGSGLPIDRTGGVRCGYCKGQHENPKAVKLCHLVSREQEEIAKADYLAELRAEQWFENRGYEAARADEEREAQMGISSFGQAWHDESPETCPCCND